MKNTVVFITAIIAILATGYFAVQAVIIPSDLARATSAVQVSQVYDAALYHAVMAALSLAVYRMCEQRLQDEG